MSIAFPEMTKEEFRKLLDDAGVSYTEVAEGEGGIFIREEEERGSSRARTLSREAALCRAASRKMTPRRPRRKTAEVGTVVHINSAPTQKNVQQRRQGK